MGWDGDAKRESLEGVETIVRAFFSFVPDLTNF